MAVGRHCVATVNHGTKEAQNESVIRSQNRPQRPNTTKGYIMRMVKSVKLALATGCCLALALVVNANPRHGNSGQMGNSTFGHSQGMNPQTGSGNSSFGRMTAEEAKQKQKAKSKKAAQRKKNHGNSAFGHRQGDPTTRTTGSQNNAYGQQTAARHRSESGAARSKKSGDTDVSPGTSTTPGNSAFGHRQGDPATRTTGSQNNAYGKAQSQAAQAKHGDNATTTPAPSPGQ
jgi:hypothetical protein